MNVGKIIRDKSVQKQIAGRELKLYKLISCKVMQREAYYCAARSVNIVDVVLMPQGLHDEPDRLRKEVQAELDKTTDIQQRQYDAVLLGYGLCSNGIVGLKANITTVVARGHDCMTLLLGSKGKYKTYFENHRGVYWYSPGWIENNIQPGRERYEMLLAAYREKYGDDNAEYLMEVEQGWMKEYSWATYIDWGICDNDHYKEYTRKCAEFLNWNYDQVDGDSSLLQRMLDGPWDKEDFLVVEPGKRITEDLTSEGIINTE